MKVALFILAFVSVVPLAQAEKPYLHPLFTDHAVLQRDGDVRIWGWSKPGSSLKVKLGDASAEATANDDGRWEVSIKAPPVGGPYSLDVSGPKQVTLKDLYVGDVWLCSGQSNMEWSVANSDNPDQEIKDANHPNIRLFTVPKKVSAAPIEVTESSWEVCSPETIGDFSAVGYHFGRTLQEHDPNVPIGLIDSSWGGTIAEAWTSGEALDTLPDFRGAVADVRAWADLGISAEQREANFQAKLQRWAKANDPGHDLWNREDHDSASWDVMELPGAWEESALPGFDGLVWFRKVVQIPKGWVGHDLELSLGPIDDEDVTYVNGQQVGETSGWNQPRKYVVSASHWKEGDNLISIRVLDNSGGGGFHGDPKALTLKPAGKQGTDTVSLGGYWEYKVGGPLDQLGPLPVRFGTNPNVASVLYNGMIAPLLPYSIKGAIWYQGESNAGRPTQYRTLLPTMIGDWRERFQKETFPFHIVQLANFMERVSEPQESNWAALREAQALAAANDPQTGLAVIIDIGEANDIHPRNKQDVGKRLAMAERGLSGPVYRDMTVKGSEAYVNFDHTSSGLLVNGGGLAGFEIAGSDKKFVQAKARLDGVAVVVHSPVVDRPVAVRYGWANNPRCNLYNRVGLPAVPFRTDTEAVAMPGGYESLFDGKTLQGWRQINGTATYEVEDGTIVGTTTKGSPNSFLCSEKRYGDYELQFEVLLKDDQLNSGVQIRSNSYAHYQNHRVHGYQVEIEPNGTAGYIYDEARRGWLSTDRDDKAANAAFKRGTWNHYRILCLGDRIRTWVNGVPVANVTDSLTSEGFIGLQVHGVGGDPHWKVAWRNLWIREIDSERGEPIFNGRDLTGWTSKSGGWGVDKEGALARLKQKAGYLWSEKTYEDFVLDLEFKTAAKCNSGVFFRTDPSNPVQGGFEIQLYDSYDKATVGNHDCGALYDAVAPRINAVKPAGEWNRLVVKALGPQVKISLNGEEVVTANLDRWDTPQKNPDGSKNKFKRALKDLPRTGHIGFQDHGHPVWFRNVYLRTPD